MFARIQSALSAFRSAFFDAAGGGSRWANHRAPMIAPNTWIDNPPIMRARALAEARNNPIAVKCVESIIGAVIGGSGILPQWRSDQGVALAWRAFMSTSDLEGRLDWTGLLALVLRTLIVEGECFVLLSVDRGQLKLQVLGPEFLDTSKVNGTTAAGIEFDGPRRTAYWLYERNPSEPGASLRSVRVDAADCLHIFKPQRPGAQRGASWLGPVLLALKELDEYLQSMGVRAKVGAQFVAFLRTPDGSNPLQADATVPSLEPGSVVRLRPNEDVEFSDPPDMGVTLDPFVRSMLRRIAAGLGIPYEILSGDHSSVTFASGRHGLIEWQRQIESIVYSILVPQLCIPIYRRWVALSRATGAIGEDPPEPRWIAPRLEMLDAGAEVRAQIAAIRAGLTSRREAVSVLGWNVEEIDREIAADNGRADSLGLVLDSDPRKTAAQGQIQQEAKGESSNGD